MAAALGAPVGGVLFALEETSSHLSALLIWRTFTAALATTLVLAFLKVSLLQNEGEKGRRKDGRG